GDLDTAPVRAQDAGRTHPAIDIGLLEAVFQMRVDALRPLRAAGDRSPLAPDVSDPIHSDLLPELPTPHEPVGILDGPGRRSIHARSGIRATPGRARPQFGRTGAERAAAGRPRPAPLPPGSPSASLAWE